MAGKARDLREAFYHAYGKSGVWMGTFWLGRNVYKAPTDLWMYQEILHWTQPDLIIETGTHSGGSAHYLACMCDLLDRGRVLTIDLDPQDDLPEHPRITYVTGSSIAPEVLEHARSEAAAEERVMVILDSDHSRDHVLTELREYAPLVTEGCHVVVEDTTAELLPGHGPGPDEAIEEFLKENDSFMVDDMCEKFMLTFNRGGYLRRRPTERG